MDTQTINNMRKYNDGYKTLTSAEIGQHSQVVYSLIKSDLLPSHKLVYAYLRSYMNGKTGTSTVSLDTLASKIGYSRQTIFTAIKTLEERDYIFTETKRKKCGVANKYATTYNVYSFPKKDEMFAMISFYFLASSIIDTKEKEFILLLFPYILGNDTIGSLDSPVFTGELTQLTRLTTHTVLKRVNSLMGKKLLTYHSTRYSNTEEPAPVGYKFDMRSIMLDANHNLIIENNELREAVLTQPELN